MATIPKSPVKVSRTINGGTPMEFFFPEASGQTFLAGKSVYITNGYVSDFNAAADNGTTRLLGFASGPGNNLTTSGVPNAVTVGTLQSQMGKGLIGVYVGPYTVFEANITSNGTDIAGALSQVGQLYPLYQDASLGFSYIDVADTGSKINCVNTLKPSTDTFVVGDTAQRFEFTLTPASLQVFGAN